MEHQIFDLVIAFSGSSFILPFSLTLSTDLLFQIFILFCYLHEAYRLCSYKHSLYSLPVL